MIMERNAQMLKKQVDKAINLYESNNIIALQQQLYEIYLNFNKPGGGNEIINFPQKEKLGECFSLMIKYDWTKDNDILEVWAENGLYCIIDFINSIHTHQEQVVGAFDLFLHIHISRKYLINNIRGLLVKAKAKNNICFDSDDYKLGAEFVIDQLFFLSAQIIKPLVFSQKEILKGDALLSFHKILDRREFYRFRPEEIFQKAKFIAQVTESILKDI